MPLLDIEDIGTTRIVTLSRPEKRNALSAELVEALLTALAQCAADGVRLLCLRGAGKNFSAGFDFSDYEAQSEGDLLLRFVRIETLLQTLAYAPFDTLALAHGQNFGAGVDLVAACNHRIVDQAARFMMPGLRFGLVLGTRRYAALVGSGRARRVLNDGVNFGAQDALQDGFATEIIPAADWNNKVAERGAAATRLAAQTAARLHEVTIADTRSADLAELVLSAAMPGLKERIHAYRSG